MRFLLYGKSDMYSNVTTTNKTNATRSNVLIIWIMATYIFPWSAIWSMVLADQHVVAFSKPLGI